MAWVLNNYLGKYVGNLNEAQLTVALLSGKCCIFLYTADCPNFSDYIIPHHCACVCVCVGTYFIYVCVCEFVESS